MITDFQYKELQKKVDELEKKMNLLSMQLSRLLLKGDVSSMTSSSPKPLRPRHKRRTWGYPGN